MKNKENPLISTEIRGFLVAGTGLEKCALLFVSFSRLHNPLRHNGFRAVAFVSCRRWSLPFAKFQARLFPNFTGSASAKASQARAWAVSKVWAYMFSVVVVWLWPRAADTLRTSSPV